MYEKIRKDLGFDFIVAPLILKSFVKHNNFKV